VSTPVASFDVFDTVLTRTWAEPRDLFIALGRELERAGVPTGEPGTFAARRAEAEAAARRRSPGGETGLDAIHAELARQLGWDEDRSRRARETELALEAAALRPVPAGRDAVAAARRRGARVVFLSDMYLPGGFIRAQLERAGVARAEDLLLVSGEEGCGKSRGLFAVARERTGGDFSAWEHSGDHRHADDEAPRRLGIRTRPFLDARLTTRERRLRGGPEDPGLWRSRLVAAGRLARLDRPAGLVASEAQLWDLGATVAGPLFWSFVRWVLDEAARRGWRDLHFLARGGQVFHRLAQVLPRPDGLRCHYLHTSRLAFAGAFDHRDEPRLRELAAPSLAHHSVRQALANLGLEPGEVALPPGWTAEDRDRNLRPAERAVLADWLLAGPRRNVVLAALERRAARARRHLEEADLRPGGAFALVDTGWMGTIQRNIEELLGRPDEPAACPALYLGLAPVRTLRCRGESLGFTNTFRRLALRRDTTHLILLELFARGDHGPLVGFAETDGRVEPRFGPVAEAEAAGARRFQDAVLAFATRAAEMPEPWPDHAELAPVVIGNYLDFFRSPEQAEAEAVATVAHSDQMLEQRHSPLCRPMSVGEALAACLDYHRRPPCWWLAGQARLGPAAVVRGYQAAKHARWWLRTRILGEPD
jgi:FMN phosphatase YigB (HAD superfamily)